MEVNIYKAIFELEKLIEDTPLSELQRNKYKNNIQVLLQIATEWKELKDNATGTSQNK